MAGKRLVDIAALVNASREVAKKHVALRARQIDVYNRTSTLARAVRNQTDRITETAKAASFLASRLNEKPPTWAADSADTAQSQPLGDVPLHDRTCPPQESDTKGKNAESKAGSILFDGDSLKEHLDTARVEQETAGLPLPKARPLSAEVARTLQRQSEAQIPVKSADAHDEHVADLLGDGHDEDIFYRKSGHTSPVLSSLPRVKIPRNPSNTQGRDVHLPEGQMNSDSFYNATNSLRSMQAEATEPASNEEFVPDGVNVDLFHSPRVAKLLAGSIRERVKQSGLEKKATSEDPFEHSRPLGKAQDPFNTRISSGALYTTSEAVPENNNSPPSSGSGKEVPGKGTSPSINITAETQPQTGLYELRESKVPSSRLGRLWNYGGLAAGMVGGAITESLRRASGSGGEGSYMLSAGNMDRLVAKLSRMRGAALKLGQMMSFQDSKMLPAPIQEVLQRVQDRADYMPPSQRNKVLASNLGPNWQELFSSFEEKPLAAASIGQVHSATLKSTGARVAVKVQYPGVADSIDSDLSNLAILLTASRLLPKGLFLDKTIANARVELAWECDYIREAECGIRFQELLADEKDVFVVPKIHPEASGKHVLTMEFMDGVGVTRVQSFTQDQKDWIGTQILRLCLREITEFRFMQTDPNWTNFLYNAKTNKLELLDFGASREYPEHFIEKYTQLLEAASRSDKDAVRALSIDLGYLTGHESKAMLNAHISSILTLAEPFLATSPAVYDFREQTITDRVKNLIPIMIRERLAPPPEETYSLHRKLSGAFLLCARLGSRVKCRELFENSMRNADIHAPAP